MIGRLAVLCAIAAAASACGGEQTRSASSLRACVAAQLPLGFADRIATHTEQGVTSITYFHHGNEIDVTVFKNAKDAIAAEKAEARLGDAHDRRTGNVLHSGGGAIEDAVVNCLR